MNISKKKIVVGVATALFFFSGLCLFADSPVGQRGESMPPSPAGNTDSVEDNLPHHMRIAALQCNFEGGYENTLKVADIWACYGFNVEQLFHTHCEKYNAVFNNDKHVKLLK